MKKTKKKKEAFKPWVRRIHKMLREYFFIKEYDYDIYWEKENKGRVGATIDIDIKYLTYDLVLYPVLLEKYKNGEYYEVFKTITHEMAHIYTEPLYIFAIDAVTNLNREYLETIREQQTERIASCVYELIPEKLYKPK